MGIIGLDNAELDSSFRLTVLHPHCFCDWCVQLWPAELRLTINLSLGFHENLCCGESRRRVQCCPFIIWNLSEFPREGGGDPCYLLMCFILTLMSRVLSAVTAVTCSSWGIWDWQSSYTRQFGAQEVFWEEDSTESMVLCSTNFWNEIGTVLNTWKEWGKINDLSN